MEKELHNKKITTVLFDLDGTLLPMDQEMFVKAYFGGLAKKLAPYGYEPDKLIKGIWAGTGAMIKNDGAKTNENVFWDCFCSLLGESARNDEPLFEKFYEDDFDKVRAVCGYTDKARTVVDKCKANGFKIALATNPIFPNIATSKRIKWAGLDASDFEYVTTYENSSYCKPNKKYYEKVLEKLNVTADECLMVGNDVDDDMVTGEMGMTVFLLTDCLINAHGKDVSAYNNGSFDDLLAFIETL